MDLVIARELGRLILEMNARPGLNNPIANRAGLTNRLARIDEIYNKDDKPAYRARIARREFPAARQTSMLFSA